MTLLRRISLFLLLVTPGCAPGEEGASPFTMVIDTIDGVVHVRHTGAAPEWRLEPLVSIGSSGTLTGDPSPEEFGRVESVIADAEGRVFVADGLALEIRVFDQDGRFLRRLGRKGAGPGEMEGLHGIAWLTGDTMLVMDYGNARLTRLTSDGEPTGHWPWLRLTGNTRFLFNGGPGETYAHSFSRAEAGASRSTRDVWVRYTPEGATDSIPIPHLDSSPGMVICRGNGIGFFSNPFADKLLRAPAPALKRVVARAAAYRLAFLDPSGDTVRVVSREQIPVPLPDSAWNRVEQNYQKFRTSWRGADCEGTIERPPHRPILLDIFFAHDGRMIVEHTTPEGEAYDLFESEGGWLGTFAAPADRDRSVPPFLRADRLYLVSRDSLGVQRVQGYRLTEPDHSR